MYTTEKVKLLERISLDALYTTTGKSGWGCRPTVAAVEQPLIYLFMPVNSIWLFNVHEFLILYECIACL